MDEDRRKDGWTWAKEIIGTVIGVTTVLAIPGGWLFVTIQSMQTQQALHTVEIAHLKEAKLNNDNNSLRIDDKLARILEQITEVRVQAAKKP